MRKNLRCKTRSFSLSKVAKSTNFSNLLSNKGWLTHFVGKSDQETPFGHHRGHMGSTLFAKLCDVILCESYDSYLVRLSTPIHDVEPWQDSS